MKSIFFVGARGIPDVMGGVEKMAERLFPLIVKRGWKMCVAGWKPNMQAGQYRGVSLWFAPVPGFLKNAEPLYSILTLFKAFRMRPDIVQLAGLGPAFWLWAYKLTGCKIVVRLGADCHRPPRSRAGNWAMRCAKYQLRWADSIITVTPALAKTLRASGIGHNIHVIGNALDRAENHPDRLSPPVRGDYILIAGEISQQQNIHGLIAAFRVFVRSYPQMQLVIVGEWDKSAGRKQIEALGDNRIVTLDSLPQSHLAPLYRGARFFVHPSIREGHSHTLLEAISFGCPVLLSDLPENRDLRLNAKHYFDPEDIRSMVSALHRAHANPYVFRVNSDRFPQWEEIAEQTMEVYEKLFADDAAHRALESEPSRI